MSFFEVGSGVRIFAPLPRFDGLYETVTSELAGGYHYVRIWTSNHPPIPFPEAELRYLPKKAVPGPGVFNLERSHLAYQLWSEEATAETRRRLSVRLEVGFNRLRSCVEKSNWR